MKLITVVAILILSISKTDDIPDFVFISPDGSEMTKSKFEKGKPVIVFYFDPEYTSSIDQADHIYYGEEDYIDINILWVSTASHEINSEFLDDNFSDLDLSLINVAKDPDNKFEDWFGYAEAPTAYVYNSEWKLVDRFFKVEGTGTLLRNIQGD